MPKIDSAFLRPVINDDFDLSPERKTLFDNMLKHHRHRDIDNGRTSFYIMNKNNPVLTNEEWQEIKKLIDPVFVQDDFLNQHYLHSLEQFYSIVQMEWVNHIERTNALIGTPQGKI